MKPGERVLVYHTGDEKAVVGTAEVVRSAYPDPKYPEGKLLVVDIEARGRLARPVTLAEIKALAEFRTARSCGRGGCRSSRSPPRSGRRSRRWHAHERARRRAVDCRDGGGRRSPGPALVERRLAACVSVVPGVVSHHRFEGEQHRDAELLLVIKTRAEKIDALRAALVELHPYELPEFVALDITGRLRALPGLAGREREVVSGPVTLQGGSWEGGVHACVPFWGTSSPQAPLGCSLPTALTAPAPGPSPGPPRPRSPR